MSENFPLKYRPEKFSDMIGQTLTAHTLQLLVNADDVPHGILFSGPSGTGKTTAARILAAEMNPDQRADIVAGVSPDVVEIDAASNGGVGEIRRVLESLRYQSSPGSKRVLIYDEAHSITREGFNALLKPTEEDSGTTFVFVTTEPEKIPPTVLSRLTEFEFHRVSPLDIYNRLLYVKEKEVLTCEPDLLKKLALSASGNVRTALSYLNLVAKANILTLEEYDSLRGDRDYAPDLLEAVLSGDHGKIFSSLDETLNVVSSPAQVSTALVHLMRDLLVVRSKGTLLHSGIALAKRSNLALRIEPDQITAVIKLLWDLKTRVRGSSDGLGDIETALILIAGILAKGRVSTPAAVPVPTTPEPVQAVEPERRLSFAELQQSHS